MTEEIKNRLKKLRHFIITDIDHTLIGENNNALPELISLIRNNRETIGFAVATGRVLNSAVEHLEKHLVPSPDIIISSVGTEIYYGTESIYDLDWDRHLTDMWNGQKVREILTRFDFLVFQPEEAQAKFKVSCFMEPHAERLHILRESLDMADLRYTLIYSNDRYLDVLPYRASKGTAVKHLILKWKLNPDNIIVFGDSGNDEEMLRGDAHGVVVGNYNRELDKLRGFANIYFAKGHCAAGMLEGLAYHRFIDKARE